MLDFFAIGFDSGAADMFMLIWILLLISCFFVFSSIIRVAVMLSYVMLYVFKKIRKDYIYNMNAKKGEKLVC